MGVVSGECVKEALLVAEPSHAARQFEGSADRFLQSTRPPLLPANETLEPRRH